MTIDLNTASEALLQELQTRVADSQKQLAEATQRLQLAQQIHLQAQGQFNIWNGALQTIARERHARAVAAHDQQIPLPGTKSEIHIAESEVHDTHAVPNKTEIIRELVRQYPTGISASDIWRQVGSQLKHRAYLYSVLKRLRGREELMLRRNKYVIRPHVEVSETAMVQ